MLQDIIIPIYFLEKDDGEKVIDEDSVKEEFEYKLKEAIKLINEEG